MDERLETIVVGGGQAGLAAASFLSAAGHRYLILDAGERFGHTWRNRWDSLRLFTPAKFSGLPGMKFPGEDFSFPSKDEAAAYLASYAASLNPPVRFGTRVDSLAAEADGFVLSSGTREFRARRVIVATGAYQVPSIPALAAELDPGILQLHSRDYRNPAQLPEGPVLVVGAGNSGVEIALELKASGRRVWLSGRDVGRIPADTLGRVLGGRPYWWLISRVLSVDTPLGRKVRSAALSRGTPLIGAHPDQVAKAGVTRVERTVGSEGGKPRLADGRTLEVSAVVWATGFRADYSWIRLPIFDERGLPRHDRGIAREVRGLCFLGLPFQVSLSSSLIGGVGADARFVTRAIAA